VVVPHATSAAFKIDAPPSSKPCARKEEIFENLLLTK
jgi:hypothetical protein